MELSLVKRFVNKVYMQSTIQKIIVVILLISASMVNAQVTDVPIQPVITITQVKPISFWNKVELFFIFNKERKAEKLQDFSGQDFKFAVQKMNEGDVQEAQKFFDKSNQRILQANKIASSISDSEIRQEVLGHISELVAIHKAEYPIDVQTKIENVSKKEIMSVGENTKEISTNSHLQDVCDSKTEPYIKVLSPNGEETYIAGESITVKWKSCNIPNTSMLEVNVSTTSHSVFSFLAGMTGTINDGIEMFSTEDWPSGSDYTIIIGIPKKGDFTNSALSLSDASDSHFSVLLNNTIDNSSDYENHKKGEEISDSLPPPPQGHILEFDGEDGWFSAKSEWVEVIKIYYTPIDQNTTTPELVGAMHLVTIDDGVISWSLQAALPASEIEASHIYAVGYYLDTEIDRTDFPVSGETNIRERLY